MAAVAAEAGIEFVDAPVSGSDEAARGRQLVVLASGAERAHERVTPVLDAVGRRTLWGSARPATAAS